MATNKTKNAAKTLIEGASDVLERVVRLRRAADSLINTLRRIDTELTREKEDEALRRKHEEMQKAQSAHAKAYTMLDEDEQAQIEAVIKAENEKKAKGSEKNEQTEQVETETPEEKSDGDAKLNKHVRKSDTDAESTETAEAVSDEKSEAVKSEPEKKPSKKSAKKADGEAGQENGEEKTGEKAEGEKPKKSSRRRGKAEPKTPIGQIISRAGEDYPQKKTNVGLAPNVVRPPKPAGQTATTHVGMFVHSAPAVVRQTVPLRPAQPAGQRPAGGQPGTQGGRGPRPAYGANRPQGQFGNRPAGQQQGGRPQGGGYGGRSQGVQRNAMRGIDMTPTVEKERVSNYDPNKKNYIRQHDPEHIARNRKQASKSQSNFNGYDDEVIRGGKRSRVKKPSAQQMMAPIKIESATMAGDTITVRDLTEKIGKPAGEIIKKLFMLGNMATINSEIDFDTAQLVCSDFEITLERKQEQTAEAELVAEEKTTDEDTNLRPRSPVVTIMGHVDHGKTSLLDYIRKSRVTAGEAGGITQHIGAYTVSVRDGQSITFLDTPGHEAFTAMRARGTQATDIAVLVVAADDSVMPQTVESINHAKAADVPIIVAINKMDKPEANAEKVKQDLTQYGLVCEDWGGDTICVPVSALTGQGVDELLEMILLQADMLQLQANPDRLGRGVIIEAKLDKARGPLATVLVQNGTLHTGDYLIAGMASGRVRALINDRGQKVNAAGPSMPVEIMGFDDVPSAGDEMIAVGDERLSRQVADERREKLKASREASMAKMSMENLFSSIEAGKLLTLNLIIKADVQGSVEAVKQAAEKLSNDEVKVRVLHSAAGAITQDDVNLANAFNAIIIGFNIRPDASAREAADKAGVDVRLYTVIYQAIEDMELAMKGLLKPEYKETLLGHAEVRNIFKITGVGTIAGCYVQDGKVQRNANVRLLRDQVVVFEGKLSSLKHLKDDVKEMAEGYECGMSLEGHNDIKEGDIVECFIMEEIPR